MASVRSLQVSSPTSEQSCSQEDCKPSYNRSLFDQGADVSPFTADPSADELSKVTLLTDQFASCERCGYSWRPRVENPLHCSRCKCRRTILRVIKTKRDFWENVDKSGGVNACWPFTGLVNRDGYGVYRKEAAMREAYRLTYGPIPDGTEICHHCDNRICCNPKHIYAGTHQENIADRVRRGRTVTPQMVKFLASVCICGHHGRLAHNAYGCEGQQIDGPCACQRSCNEWPAVVIKRGYRKAVAL